MSVDMEKNIYGLSEGVFKACQFLGLEFPSEVPTELDSSQEHAPSDYFGDDFELDEAAKQKLRAERKWKKEQFKKTYTQFKEKFLSQRCFKHNKTDLNVYFCDYMLFAEKQTGASVGNYFNFEFHKKSFGLRKTFLTERHSGLRIKVCNDKNSIVLTEDKSKANALFANFIHRDWLDTRNCTFKEFKAFIEKYPRFFSKPVMGIQGKSAKIVSIESNENLEKIFANLKVEKALLEEIIKQHEALSAFCPNAVNTIRLCTILDMHNVVHILTASGRFGRARGVIDNFHGGGISVIINPITGIITSDGISLIHERFQKHPDTGKIFKGFKYPCWEKVRKLVKTTAKMIPQLRHIGWDITINDKGDAVIVEVNSLAGPNIQQAPDDTGRWHLYQPLLEEIRDYKKAEIQLLGWRVNNLGNFRSAYEFDPLIWNPRLRHLMSKIIPDCMSIMDLGCRKSKLVKSVMPPEVYQKYYPVDFQKHDDEVIACDFNEGEFPDIKADVCICALTAEFVELLPQFLANMCNAAKKQILMLCRPVDKEIYDNYRWKHPFLTDFTEDFLIKTMQQNHFELKAKYPDKNPSVILYDFRKI